MTAGATSLAGWRRWAVLLAAVAACALTARLGVWQLDRAAQKTALQAAQERQRALPPLGAAGLAADAKAAAAQQHRAVVLEGRWDAARTVYLENRQMNGRPGFYALTPLVLADGSAVVVQRGWLPRDQADRTRIVAAPPPPGPVRVQGRIAPAPSRLYEFDGASSGPIRQNLDLDAYARETGLALRPLTVVMTGDADPPDGLLRDWPVPAADVHKHYGYAFQWFSLSALVAGLYVWFQLLRPRLRARRAA